MVEVALTLLAGIVCMVPEVQQAPIMEQVTGQVAEVLETLEFRQQAATAPVGIS